MRRSTPVLWAIPLVAVLAAAGAVVHAAGETTADRAVNPESAPPIPAPSSSAASKRPVPKRAPLSASADNLLPLTSVKPTGWLKRQLKTQATGLGAPVELRVNDRRVPEWVLAEGCVAAASKSPVASSSPVEILTLIPDGSAKFGITVFPRVTP